MDYEDKYYGEPDNEPSAEDTADYERDNMIAEQLEKDMD